MQGLVVDDGLKIGCLFCVFIEADLFGDGLEDRQILGAGRTPAVGTPDFETALATEKHHVARESRDPTVIIRQQNTPLLVGRDSTCGTVKRTDCLALEAGGLVECFDARLHARKLRRWKHNQKRLVRLVIRNHLEIADPLVHP